MAKTTGRSVLLSEVDPNAPDDTVIPETDQDELRALAELDGAGDVKFQVWRTFPLNEAGFCGDLSASELTMDRVQQDFGKGKYRIRGLRSNGTYVGQRTVTIAQGPKFTTAPVSGQGASGVGIAEFLAMEEAKAKARNDELKSWAVILAPMFAPIIANLFGASKGPTLADLTTTLANMKALAAPESGVSKLGEIKELLSLVREMAPDTATGSTWPDLIKEGLQQVGPVLGAVVAARQQGQAPAPNPLGTQVEPDLSPMPPLVKADTAKEENTMLKLLGWLKEQLSGLAHQASLNKDPSLYAEVVIDNIPPGVDPKMLREYLAREDWWPMLTQFMPAVQPYPEWFAECRQELLNGLDQLIATLNPPPPKGAKKATPMPVIPDTSGEES